MKTYDFNAEKTFSLLKYQWLIWAESNGFSEKKWVVGISGGKDSTVTAALAARIFGRENVVGVLMPCGEQPDISDAEEAVQILGIKRVRVNIGKSFADITGQFESPENSLEVSEDSKINLPARLRMSTLYAVAQSVDGIVLNTSNLTENYLSFMTLVRQTFTRNVHRTSPRTVQKTEQFLYQRGGGGGGKHPIEWQSSSVIASFNSRDLF